MCLKVYSCSTILFSQNIRETVKHYLVDFLRQIIDIQQKKNVRANPQRKNLYNWKVCHVSHQYVVCLYSGKNSRQCADRLNCCTSILNVISTVILIHLLIYRKGFLVRCGTAKKNSDVSHQLADIHQKVFPHQHADVRHCRIAPAS